MWKVTRLNIAADVPTANQNGARPIANRTASIAVRQSVKSTKLNRKRAPNARVLLIITALTKPASIDTVLVCGRPHDLVILPIQLGAD